MLRSLFTDPLSWWPVGIVIGGLAGAVLRRRDRTRSDAEPTHPRGRCR